MLASSAENHAKKAKSAAENAKEIVDRVMYETQKLILSRFFSLLERYVFRRKRAHFNRWQDYTYAVALQLELSFVGSEGAKDGDGVAASEGSNVLEKFSKVEDVEEVEHMEDGKEHEGKKAGNETNKAPLSSVPVSLDADVPKGCKQREQDQVLLLREMLQEKEEQVADLRMQTKQMDEELARVRERSKAMKEEHTSEKRREEQSREGGEEAKMYPKGRDSSLQKVRLELAETRAHLTALQSGLAIQKDTLTNRIDVLTRKLEEALALNARVLAPPSSLPLSPSSASPNEKATGIEELKRQQQIFLSQVREENAAALSEMLKQRQTTAHTLTEEREIRTPADKTATTSESLEKETSLSRDDQVHQNATTPVSPVMHISRAIVNFGPGHHVRFGGDTLFTKLETSLAKDGADGSVARPGLHEKSALVAVNAAGETGEAKTIVSDEAVPNDHIKAWDHTKGEARGAVGETIEVKKSERESIEHVGDRGQRDKEHRNGSARLGEGESRGGNEEKKEERREQEDEVSRRLLLAKLMQQFVLRTGRAPTDSEKDRLLMELMKKVSRQLEIDDDKDEMEKGQHDKRYGGEKVDDSLTEDSGDRGESQDRSRFSSSLENILPIEDSREVESREEQAQSADLSFLSSSSADTREAAKVELPAQWENSENNEKPKVVFGRRLSYAERRAEYQILNPAVTAAI